MTEPPDLSLFLEKNYGLRLASVKLVSQSNELVYFIQTVDGQRFGLKTYRSSGAPSAGRLAVVGAFLTFLSERGWPVQVPVSVVGEPPAMLHRWLEGRIIALPFSESGAKNWGATMARLHLAAEEFWLSATVAGGGADNGQAMTLLDENWVKTTARWLASELSVHGFSKKEVATLSKKLDWLAARTSFFEKMPSSFGLIHSDLHRTNLLRVGRRLTAIDWDETALGPFLLDAAVFLGDFESLLPEERNRRTAAFWAGYSSVAFHPKNGHVRATGGEQFSAIAAERLRKLSQPPS